MNILHKYGIWIIGVLALFHQLIQHLGDIHLPILSSYLDDVLCMPLFLHLWAWEREQLWQLKAPLNKTEVILFTFAFFILFEGFFPHWSDAFTRDWKDGIAYSLGSVVFLCLRRI